MFPLLVSHGNMIPASQPQIPYCRISCMYVCVFLYNLNTSIDLITSVGSRITNRNLYSQPFHVLTGSRLPRVTEVLR